VHTEISAASGADTPYDRRPWLSQYPPDVAPSLELPSESIWDVLENTVKRFGDRSALVFQNFGMTYRELRDHAARMSSALRAAGVEEGDVVLALLPNLPHFPVTYYGTLRLGAALTTASPLSVEREIEAVIKDSGATVIVTLDLLFEKVANVFERCGVHTVVVGSATDFMPWWARIAGKYLRKAPQPKQAVTYGGKVQSLRRFLRGGRVDIVVPPVPPEKVALLQYTGGTTGLPKAAMLTHASLLANARQITGFFP